MLEPVPDRVEKARHRAHADLLDLDSALLESPTIRNSPEFERLVRMEEVSQEPIESSWMTPDALACLSFKVLGVLQSIGMEVNPLFEGKESFEEPDIRKVEYALRGLTVLECGFKQWNEIVKGSGTDELKREHADYFRAMLSEDIPTMKVVFLPSRVPVSALHQSVRDLVEKVAAVNGQAESLRAFFLE